MEADPGQEALFGTETPTGQEASRAEKRLLEDLDEEIGIRGKPAAVQKKPRPEALGQADVGDFGGGVALGEESEASEESEAGKEQTQGFWEKPAKEEKHKKGKSFKKSSKKAKKDKKKKKAKKDKKKKKKAPPRPAAAPAPPPHPLQFFGSANPATTAYLKPG